MNESIHELPVEAAKLIVGVTEQWSDLIVRVSVRVKLEIVDVHQTWGGPENARDETFAFAQPFKRDPQGVLERR